MSRLSARGDFRFQLRRDGTFVVDSSVGRSKVIGLEDLEVLLEPRTSSAGSDSAEVRARLADLEGAGLVAREGAELSPEERRRRPVLFAGTGRCGGNLLKWIIDAHPRLCSPPYNTLLSGLHELSAAEDMFQALGTLRGSLRWHRYMLTGLVTRLSNDFARRRGKERMVYASLRLNGTSIDFIDALLGEEALWVMVRRHALDFIDSAYRRFVLKGDLVQMRPWLEARGGQPHLALADFWVEINRRMNTFETLNPGRTLSYRFEDLTSHPEDTVRRLLGFLGEEWSPGMLERAFQVPHAVAEVHTDHEVTKTQKIEGDRVGRWKTWPPALIARVAEVVNPTMVGSGYPSL